MNFRDVVPEHIRKIETYKPGKPIEEVERDLGISALKLASNENPWGPSPKGIAAAQRYLQNTSLYPEDTGFYLRTRLAEHYGVNIQEIIIGAGSSEILGMTFRALLRPGDEVLTSEGSFVLYYLFAQIMNVDLVAAPLRNYRYDLDAIANRITEKTKLILLANPNNPTGTMVGAAEVHRFMGRVPDGALVVFDEAYFDYVADDDFPDSFEYLQEKRPVLILRTFSKAYGLAGFRVGYGIGRGDVVEVLNKVRPPFNTPSVAQVAALAAFDDIEHVRKSVEENKRELDFLTEELQSRSFEIVPSVANFILVDVGIPAGEAFEKLLIQGVIVRSMDAAGFPTMIRVSVGKHEENEQFLRSLDRLK